MASLREELEAVLDRPIRRPEDAEQAARAAEALANYIRASQGAEEVLGLRGNEVREAPGAADLAGLTLHDAAERILDEAGIPLHVRQLGRQIKARGWTHKRSKRVRSDQINYQLAARLPRHADRFVRVAPNTFGLKKWELEGRERVKPRFALFRSGSSDTARQIGEHPDQIFEDAEWRSS